MASSERARAPGPSHPNLERLRVGMEAFANRDLATLRDMFHDEVLWHYGGTSQLAGEYSGLEEVFELFARRAALSGETYRITVQSAIANEDFITVLGATHAKRDDGKYEDTICYVYRLVNSKVVEAWGLPANPEAERAFYG